MIRIFDGIMFRIKEIITLPTPNTKITDTAITTEGTSFAVIAKAEQIPNTCMVIGLLSANGSKIRLASFLDKSPIVRLVF